MSATVLVVDEPPDAEPVRLLAPNPLRTSVCLLAAVSCGAGAERVEASVRAEPGRVSLCVTRAGSALDDVRATSEFAALERFAAAEAARGEALAEATQRTGPDLRHARLADAQVRRDLLQRLLLEEVERDDSTLGLAEFIERGADQVAGLLALETHGRGDALLFHALPEGAPFAIVGADGGVERELAGAVDVALPLPERVERQRRGEGDLPMTRRAAERVAELVADGMERARLGADRAGHAVLATEFVEDRAADAGGGEGGEGETARFVEVRDRGHETDMAGAHEFAEIRFIREGAGEPPGDEVYDADVHPQELIAGVGATGLAAGEERKSGHGGLVK